MDAAMPQSILLRVCLHFSIYIYMTHIWSFRKAKFANVIKILNYFRKSNFQIYIPAVVYCNLEQNEIHKLGLWHNKIQSHALRLTYVDRIRNIRRILMAYPDCDTGIPSKRTEAPILTAAVIDHVVETMAETDAASLQSELLLAALPTAIFSRLDELFKKMEIEEAGSLNHKVGNAP